MSFPAVRAVVVRITLSAEECEVINAARQWWVYDEGGAPTFDELIGIWAQLGVEDRAARERERCFHAE